MIGQNVEGIGIDNDGALRTAQLGNHGNSGLFGLSQARSNTQCVEVFRVDSLCKVGLLQTVLDDGLRNGYL